MRNVKKSIAWLLTLVMVMTPVLGTVSVAAGEDMPDDYKMSLYGVDNSSGAVVPGKEIKSGSEISKDDEFFIKIELATIEKVVAGTVYSLGEFPEHIAEPASDGKDTFEIAVGDKNMTFAELSWEAGNRVLKVKFMDLGKDTNGDSILNGLTDVSMYFFCKLDDENLNADDEGKITVSFPGSSDVILTVEELKPAPPKVEKTVSTIDSSGMATWTVTYTHPTAAYKGGNPVKLVDTLPAGLEPVQGSLDIRVNKVEENPVVNGEFVSNTMVYTLPTDLPASAEVVLTYKTQLTEAEMSDIWEMNKADKDKYAKKFKNTVEAFKADDTAYSPAVKASAELELDKDKWSGFEMITKTGKATNGTPYTIEWEIVVNTAGRNFKKLQVLDTMGKGLTVVNNTIKINGDTATPTIVPGASDTKMTIDLVVDGAPSPAKTKYTITYTTNIAENYFLQLPPPAPQFKDEDLNNTAKLIYQWPDGSGTGGGDRSPPEILKKPNEVGVSSSLLTKKIIGYDVKDHSLTWGLTLNPNKVNLTSAVFEDTIIGKGDDLTKPRENHSFIPGQGDKTAEMAASEATIKAAIEAALVAAGLDKNLLTSFSLTNEKVFSVKMEEIGNNTISFSFKTYVDSPDIWAGNAVDKIFENKGILKKDGTTVDNVQIARDFLPSAQQKYKSNVLSKAHTNYDPVTKKIKWTLVVNENATNLGDVVITDKLSELLSCTANDAKLNGAAFSGDNTFKVVDKEITINLKNVVAKHTITFETLVDLSQLEAMKLDKIEVENTASITSTANGNETKSNTARLEISNPVVSKTNGSPDREKREVVYTVQINPLGVNLAGAEAAERKLLLKDTLADGLYLDIDSVKLNMATSSVVKKEDSYTVKLTPGEEVGGLVTKYDSLTNAFTVEVPSASQPYILTYKAYIVRSGVPLSNKVELTGSILPNDATNNQSTKSFTLAAFGSANFKLPETKFFSIEIAKISSDKGAPLGGAVFGIYSSEDDSSLLARATSDSNTGIATIAVQKSQLGSAEKLYWKEITPPQGYLPNNTWHEVEVKSGNQSKHTLVNYPVRDAGSGEIKVKKVDAQGNVLTGAHFALYSDEDCKIVKVAATEVDPNGVVTFTGLDPSVTYWVKETKAPVGFSLRTEPMGIVAEKVATEQNFENVPANAVVNITKTNANNKPLQGANFSLYTKDKITELATGTTDANGSLEFKGLDQGDYFIKETKAPAGYRIVNEWTAVTLVLNETNNVTILNEAIRVPDDEEEESGGNPPVTPPVTPEEPETPDEPGTPVTPPVTPSEPEEPGTPSEPETPGTPSEPGTPGTPSEPGTPGTPGGNTGPTLPNTGVTNIWFWIWGLALSLIGCACVGVYALKTKHNS